VAQPVSGPAAERLRIVVLRDRETPPPWQMAALARAAAVPDVAFCPDVVIATDRQAGRAIEAYAPDIVVNLSRHVAGDWLLDGPRYGVWEFRFPDRTGMRAGPPGFWPLHDDDDVSRVVLVRIIGAHGLARPLSEATLATVRTSLAGNRDNLFRGARMLVAHMCRDILNGRGAHAAETGTPLPMVTDAPPDRQQRARLAVRIAGNRTRRVWDAAFRHQDWNIGIIDAPPHRLLEIDGPPEISWLPRRGPAIFAADPFALATETGLYIMYEEFDRRRGKGVIAALAQESGMTTRGPQPVLETPGHLAYPFLFRHGGVLYCIPENAAGREVTLYRLDGRFRALQRVKTLISGVAALDTTVFRHEGLWWLMYCDSDDGRCDSLHAWYADDPLGAWQPHRFNPVKTDIRSARPAGTPFRHHGALYRPAQDCARGYGGRITLNRIDRLSPTDFAETTVAVVEPDKDGPWPDGLHTITGAGNITVVDGQRRRFFASALVGAIRRRLAAGGKAAPPDAQPWPAPVRVNRL
jgi:hypothetical protein